MHIGGYNAGSKLSATLAVKVGQRLAEEDLSLCYFRNEPPKEGDVHFTVSTNKLFSWKWAYCVSKPLFLV